MRASKVRVLTAARDKGSQIIPTLSATDAQHRSPSEIVLVFEPGFLPETGEYMRIAAEQADIFASTTANGTVELRHGGMTFDIVAPGDSENEQPMPFDHRVGVSLGVRATPRSTVRLVPGPHIADGTRMVPVLREWLSLAARLVAALPHVEAVGWPPAHLLMDGNYFCRHVAGWLAGGMFPASVLCVFVPSLGQTRQSEGLAWFTGQELRLEGDLGGDGPMVDRLAQRLAAHLVHVGTLTGAEDMTLPDGRTVRLEPSPNGRFVIARIV